MSHRGPAKLPSLSQTAAGGSSHHYVCLPQYGQQETPDEIGMVKAAIKTITLAFDDLTVNQFYTVSPMHTPVHSHAWKPDPEQFKRMVLRALAFVEPDADEEQVRAAMESKTSLNEQLAYIDNMLVKSEQSGLPVNKARLALSWLIKRNRETYLELHARPKSHPLDRNPLPAIPAISAIPAIPTTPRHVRWADQEYSTSSPNGPGRDKFPEEIYTRFLVESARYNKHNVTQASPSNGYSPNGYAWQGYSPNGSPNPGRTQVYVRNADNTVAPRSCLKPADENVPFIPPHPSYFSKDCELATALNRGKPSSKE